GSELAFDRGPCPGGVERHLARGLDLVEGEVRPGEGDLRPGDADLAGDGQQTEAGAGERERRAGPLGEAAQRRDLQLDRAIEPWRRRAGGAAAEAEGNGLRIEPEPRRAGFAAEKGTRIGEFHLQGELLAAIDGGAIGRERAVEIGQRHLHGDLLKLEALAAALIEIADLAVL